MNNKKELYYNTKNEQESIVTIILCSDICMEFIVDEKHE